MVVKNRIKFEIEYSKRILYTLILISVLVIGAWIVFAWANPTTGVGHGLTELETCASGQIIKMSGGNWVCANEIDYSGIEYYGYHPNNCDATEEFITMTSNGNLGLCFEINERPIANWFNAWQTCINIGKKMPDYLDWKKACDTGTSLTNMTNNWEWAESTPAAFVDSTESGSNSGVAGAVAGNMGCNKIDAQYINSISTGINPFSTYYRCVR